MAPEVGDVVDLITEMIRSTNVRDVIGRFPSDSRNAEIALDSMIKMGREESTELTLRKLEKGKRKLRRKVSLSSKEKAHLRNTRRQSFLSSSPFMMLPVSMSMTKA